MVRRKRSVCGPGKVVYRRGVVRRWRWWFVRVRAWRVGRCVGSRWERIVRMSSLGRVVRLGLGVDMVEWLGELMLFCVDWWCM